VIENVLKVGGAVLLIASRPHGAGILQRLAAGGIDVDAFIAEKRLTSLDTADIVSTFMVNDALDPVACAKLVGDLINRVMNGVRGDFRLAILGECAPTLLAEGNTEAAIQLEHLWDEITREHHVDTLCGYTCSTLPRKKSEGVFQRIRAEHSAVHGRPLSY
jgi:MEDS: MEthanogen/methylotroph, DcmR Sensory domain